MQLETHFTYLTDAVAAARAAPLSARKAMLAALLLDAYADRLFDAGTTGAEDVLAWRAQLAERHEALALVFALAAARPDGPHLVTEAVEVPVTDYPALAVADYMVSLYNQNSVQRVRIALPDGSRRDVHEVLAAALAALGQSALSAPRPSCAQRARRP